MQSNNRQEIWEIMWERNMWCESTWLLWWIVLPSWWWGVSVDVWACMAASPPQMSWGKITAYDLFTHCNSQHCIHSITSLNCAILSHYCKWNKVTRLFQIIVQSVQRFIRTELSVGFVARQQQRGWHQMQHYQSEAYIWGAELPLHSNHLCS